MLNKLINNFLNRFQSIYTKNAVSKIDPQGVILPPQVYVAGNDSSLGKGVFANCEFNEGDVIECCPVLIIEEPLNELSDQLKVLAFDWGALTNQDDLSAIMLGWGNLYKHQNLGNMKYEVDPVQPGFIFKALQLIQKGEELTVNYEAIGGMRRCGTHT